MKALALSLVASILLNLGLGFAYLGQRDKITTLNVTQSNVGTEIAKTEVVAEACSTGVDQLAVKAETRVQDATVAREEGKAKAVVHYIKADRVLMAPAPVPQQDCASAQERASQWLKERNNAVQ